MKKKERKIGKKNKIDFVSLVAHQLKTSLSAMKLSFQMLLNGDFGALNQEQKDIIEKLHQRNNMLIHSVNDLLNMIRIEDKGYFYHFDRVDIEDLINSIIIFSQEELKRKKIIFQFEKPIVKLPKIMLDKEKICLAIQNIFDNSIKYTPLGGQITISLKNDNKNLEIKIQDSGIGIPDSQKKNIFEKFFRGSNAVKAQTIGSGLGLFITKEIIESHQGKIWFESKENKGSTFFITIPIKTKGD